MTDTMGRLRVAIVHSFYSAKSPSGENVMVEAQAKALVAAGHDVRLIAVFSDDLSKSRFYPFVSAINVATGLGISPLDELNEFRPDVVHVHNLFPNFSTRWLSKWDGPIVATLHNFRPVCAAGTLYRNSQPCNLCPQEGSHHGVLNSCYRNSALATLPLAFRNRRSTDEDEVLARADRLIVLSRRAELLYRQAGLTLSSVRILENFVDAEGFEPTTAAGSSWVFLGRLTEEKGILKVLENWPAGHSLTIYGDGPLRSVVIEAAHRNIVYGGQVSRSEIPTVLSQARGLIFSSLWAEGAVPLTYIESLAAGRPVVSISGNAAADDILENKTGAVFAEWSEFHGALSRVDADIVNFSRRARRRYEIGFGADDWLKKISALYREVILERNN